MTEMIDQFMWAYQHTFRISVEYEIQEVLSQIGLQIHDKAKVLLIGLATDDDLRHQTCIEPENGPLVVDDLRSIVKRTDEISEADPESNIFDTNRRYHERRQRELFFRSRAHAIAGAIQQSGKFERTQLFRKQLGSPRRL